MSRRARPVAPWLVGAALAGGVVGAPPLAPAPLRGEARADDAPAGELEPAELIGRLARARKAVEDQVENAKALDEPDWESLRRVTGELHGARVRPPGSTGSFEVDPHALEELREIEGARGGQPEKLEELARRLGSLEREARRAQARTQAAAPDPGRPSAPDEPSTSGQAPPAPSSARARETLERILEQPRYRKRTSVESEGTGLGDRLESWWQRVENWWWRQARPAPASPPAAGWLASLARALASILPATFWGYLAWVAVIVAVVAALVLRRYRRSIGLPAGDETGETFEPEGPAPPPAEESFSEAHWRREARLLAERGDHRGAVRALYTGLLLLLQRAGHLKFDKGKTNWEHLRELRRNDRALAGRLEPLTRTFDVVWYGRKPVERQAFDGFLVESDQVATAIEQAPSREASP